MPTGTLRGGFSLAEVMVAASLFAVISLILTHLIITQLRFCRRASERLELDREQLLLQESLRQDLAASASAGVSLHPTGIGLALQMVEDVAFDGSVTFLNNRLVAYRYETDQILYRYSWQKNPPFALSPQPQRLSTSQWAGLLANSPQRTTLWKSLKSFRVRSEASIQDVTQRLWVDCTWQDARGPWQTSYCIFTRQNP